MVADITDTTPALLQQILRGKEATAIWPPLGAVPGLEI